MERAVSESQDDTHPPFVSSRRITYNDETKTGKCTPSKCAIETTSRTHSIIQVKQHSRSGVNSIRDNLGGRAAAAGVKFNAEVLVGPSGVVAFCVWAGAQTRLGGKEEGRDGVDDT